MSSFVRFFEGGQDHPALRVVGFVVVGLVVRRPFFLVVRRQPFLVVRRQVEQVEQVAQIEEGLPEELERAIVVFVATLYVSFVFMRVAFCEELLATGGGSELWEFPEHLR